MRIAWLSSEWPFIRMVWFSSGRSDSHQSGLLSSGCFGSHQCGLPSGWFLIRQPFIRMVTLGCFFTIVTSHQDDDLTSRQSFFRVAFHQDGLSSGWSRIRVISHQDSFSLGLPFIRMICHQGGLIRVVCHQVCLSSEWSLIRVVYL